MAELVFSESADETLGALETDPQSVQAVARIWDALEDLAEDPSASSVRTRSYQNGPWGFLVRDGDEDWLVLWQTGPGADEVTILYLGPDI